MEILFLEIPELELFPRLGDNFKSFNSFLRIFLYYSYCKETILKGKGDNFINTKKI